MSKEITTEEKMIKIKKDVVKNVAIVFLAIMLVLTFFSNSIMNKSLPEVASQYLQEGTISEAIRGTGVVTVDDPYTVTVGEARTVASVAVKQGDVVELDQVLFYLEDEESAELEEAQKTLDDLVYNYTIGALTGEMTDSAYQNATHGRVLGMDIYEAQIEAARNKVKSAQDNVDSLTRQMNYADNNTGSEDKNVELKKISTELTEAQSKVAVLQAEYDALKGTVDAGSGSENNYEFAKLEAANAEAAYRAEAEKVFNIIVADADTLSVLKNNPKYEAITDTSEMAKYIFDDATFIIKDAVALNDWVSASTGTGVDVNKLTELYKTYTEKQNALTTSEATYKAYKSAKSQLGIKQTELNNAKNKVNELQTKVNVLTNEINNNTADATVLKADLANRKMEADIALSKAKEEQAQLLLDISKTLNLANQNSIIRDQQEKVEKLRANAEGSSIKAPVAGTIMSVNITAGEKTSANEPLATIQVEGKDMTLQFSVSVEQAKKVNVGSPVSIQNDWYYDGVSAELTKIMADPDNPSKQKLLVFNINGNVSNGETLSLSIGQRSKSYDQVVPNSAIREDKNGKFIFIIEEKSTPFGNRYKAKKVPVEVLAKDDKNTAINAEVESWCYVVTTANKPVEPGQQVRLAEY